MYLVDIYNFYLNVFLYSEYLVKLKETRHVRNN
jgi:hypothetical protein